MLPRNCSFEVSSFKKTYEKAYFYQIKPVDDTNVDDNVNNQAKCTTSTMLSQAKVVKFMLKEDLWHKL